MTTPESAAKRAQPPVWVLLISRIGQVLVALVLARGSFFLFTQHNDFPLHYHPDESSKVQQIVSSTDQRRNFNHPLLMLETANFLREWNNVPDQAMELVRTGRTGSALLASIGVFALALAGAIGYGWAGLLISGMAMALCPPLLVYAHYFKEDASLVSGIMVAILGARIMISSRQEFYQLVAAAILGIGCAAAASGKYVGAVCIVPAMLVLCIARVPNWWALPLRIAVFCIFAFGTIVTINHRAFVDWTSLQIAPQAMQGMETEYEHGLRGHNELRIPSPNTYCIRTAISETMPHLWVFGAVGLLWMVSHLHITRWGIVLGAFLLTFAGALSYNAIPFGRYALPITICLYFVAAELMSGTISDLLKQTKLAWAALGVCAAAVLLLQGQRCLNFVDQYRDDSRQRAYEWVARNLPSDAVIGAEGYTSLGYDGDPLRFPHQPGKSQRTQQIFFAPQLGDTPEQIAAAGYSYVALSSMNYGRYFVRGVAPLPGAESQFRDYRKCYEALFARGVLVWSSAPTPTTNTYVNNEIRIYRISHLR